MYCLFNGKYGEHDLSNIGGIESIVKNRISGGLSVKEALNLKRTPVYTAFGITGTVAELSKRFDILPATVNYRLKYRGMTIEEALTAPKNQLQ